MRKLPIILLSFLIISCAQKPTFMSKDEASGSGFKMFIASTEYVNVVYVDKGEEKEVKELQIKFKNKEGFGTSEDEIIYWETVKSVERLEKQSTKRSFGNALLFSIFL